MTMADSDLAPTGRYSVATWPSRAIAHPPAFWRKWAALREIKNAHRHRSDGNNSYPGLLESGINLARAILPEPFQSADIDLTGPPPCTRMWMQVLKKDAARCHAGGWIEVRGVVTADTENNSWEIGSSKNEYMTLGDDFTCE
jgi:hypothetical protein